MGELGEAEGAVAAEEVVRGGADGAVVEVEGRADGREGARGVGGDEGGEVVTEVVGEEGEVVEEVARDRIHHVATEKDQGGGIRGWGELRLGEVRGVEGVGGEEDEGREEGALDEGGDGEGVKRVLGVNREPKML